MSGRWQYSCVENLFLVTFTTVSNTVPVPFFMFQALPCFLRLKTEFTHYIIPSEMEKPTHTTFLFQQQLILTLKYPNLPKMNQTFISICLEKGQEKVSV